MNIGMPLSPPVPISIPTGLQSINLYPYPSLPACSLSNLYPYPSLPAGSLSTRTHTHAYRLAVYPTCTHIHPYLLAVYPVDDDDYDAALGGTPLHVYIGVSTIVALLATVPFLPGKSVSEQVSQSVSKSVSQ